MSIDLDASLSFLSMMQRCSWNQSPSRLPVNDTCTINLAPPAGLVHVVWTSLALVYFNSDDECQPFSFPKLFVC